MPPTPSTVRYSAAAPSIVTQSDTRSHQPPQPPLPHSPPHISSATALLNSYTARHPIPSATAPSIATQTLTRSHKPTQLPSPHSPPPDPINRRNYRPRSQMMDGIYLTN